MVLGDGSVDRWAFGRTTANTNNVLQVGYNINNGNGAYLTQGGAWTNTSAINKRKIF